MNRCIDFLCRGHQVQLHRDAYLLDPRRIWYGIKKYHWYIVIERSDLAFKIGFWTFVRYERRPFAQKKETGFG